MENEAKFFLYRAEQPCFDLLALIKTRRASNKNLETQHFLFQKLRSISKYCTVFTQPQVLWVENGFTSWDKSMYDTIYICEISNVRIN